MAAGCTVKNMLLNQYKLAAINNMNNGKRATYVGECNKKRKRDLANLKKPGFLLYAAVPAYIRLTLPAAHKSKNQPNFRENKFKVRAPRI
jgi:hypothetical protein